MNKYDEYFQALEYVNHLSKVKAIVSEMLSGEWLDENSNHTDPMDNSSWDEIADSIIRNPDLVRFNFDKCPMCGMNRIQIYHQDAKHEQIGIYILLCPSCKRYFGLDDIDNNID